MQLGTRDITDALIKLIRTVSPSSVDMLGERVEDLISDRGYRSALLQLVRNIVPNGRQLKEVEFTRIEGDRTERATLRSNARFGIDEHLRADRMTDTEEEEIFGTLRAVDLDHTWITVVPAQGGPQRCEITHKILDDVIGPMVNRRVIVRAVRESNGRLRLADLELDPSEEQDP